MTRHRALVLASTSRSSIRPLIPVSEVVLVPLLRLPWRPDWKDKKR